MITVDFVKKAYLKMKTDIYYSNNMFYKNMIADFESKTNKMDVFSTVSKIYNGDLSLLSKYIKKINIIALPKKVDNQLDAGKVIYGLNDDKKIKTVNFFIDAPIEIFLLDVLWTIDIGKICYTKGKINQEANYGNILAEYKMFQLDLDNSTFFEPYFHQYSEWRNNAFSTIERLNQVSDAILVNYDVKQYFYNYQVNFKELCEFLEIEKKDVLIQEQIYKQYYSLLKKYKICKQYIDRYPLPIGLYSSRIISNIALNKYDNYMLSRISDRGYYGRYVDDMIVVIPLDKHIEKSVGMYALQNVIKSTFEFLVNENEKWIIPRNKISLNDCDSPIELEINPEKIDFYYFKKGNENITEELYKNKILMKVSDVGYYIDEEITERTIINDLFNYKNSKYVNKISDLKDTSIDKYGLSIMLTKMINYYKNVSEQDLINEAKRIPNKIIHFLSKDEGIKYYQYWEKLFNLLGLFGKKFIYQYYHEMKNYIVTQNIYNFDKDEYHNLEKLSILLKKSLYKYLSDSKSIAVSAKQIYKNDKWIQSLMINKNFVREPLFLVHENQKTKFSYDLSSDKLSYLPYWISLEEIYLYENLQYIIKRKDRPTLDHIIEKYCEYNNITRENFVIPESVKNQIPFDYRNAFLNHKFESSNNKKNNIVELLNQLRLPKHGFKESEDSYDNRFEKIANEMSDYENYYIGIASIPISKDDIKSIVESKKSKNNLKYKIMINHILNEAIDNKVNHIVFPELSIPYEWLKDIIYFSKRHNIQVTFGLQFLFDYNQQEKKTQVYNCICSIYPFYVCGIYKFMFFDMREKKYYSYEEKEMFDSNALKYNNELKYKNVIVNFKNGYFTNMLCFELTSLQERANLLDSITNLFVPVLNKDTKYFSSIIDTAARELYCFVAQSNTSVYGDSKIVGPFNSVNKDIVRVKGGENCYLAIAPVNIKTLKESRKNNCKDSIYKPLSAGCKDLLDDEVELKDAFIGEWYDESSGKV